MQLAHPRDDGLLALRVVVHPEGGVFSGEAVDAFGELVRVGLRTRQGDVKEESGLWGCLGIQVGTAGATGGATGRATGGDD